MGWTLVHNGTRQRLRLKPGKLQVGRAQTASLRLTDQSVSRLHAELVVTRHEGKISEVVATRMDIIDTSSTGHTFVNGQPLGGKGQTRVVVDGDALSFGVDPVTFTVQWSPMVLSCSSRASAADIQKMEDLARDAGVYLTSDWTANCTHLLIEQLAITPKLLSCVTAGAVPVTASFLDALAQSTSGTVSPDPSQHRPQAPAGQDAAYAAQLEACCTTPRPRRDLLKNVWVILASSQVYSVLAKALNNAGSEEVHLCMSVEDAKRLAERLCHVGTTRGMPREVWAVPHLPLDSAQIVRKELSGYPAVRNLSVPLQAVVSAIFSGSLEAIYDEASPFVDGGGTGSPAVATPPQPEQRPQTAGNAKPVSASASAPSHRAMPHESTKVKEEHGATNSQQPVPASRGQASVSASIPAGGVKRKECEEKENQGHAFGEAANRMTQGRQGAGQSEAPAASLSLKRRRLPQNFDEKSQITLTAVKEQEKPEAEDGEKIAGVAAALKTEDKKLLKIEPGEHKPCASGSRHQPSTLLSSAGPVRASGYTVDTQLSQPKVEPKPEPDQKLGRSGIRIDSSLSQRSQGTQAKLEHAPLKSEAPVPVLESGSQVKTEAAAGAAVPGRTELESAAEPVTHPTGVWLPSRKTRSSAGNSTVTVDGVAIPRATWRAGAAQVVVPASTAESRGASGQAASASSRSQRRNFKLFRKSDGQRCRAAEVVPVKLWVPETTHANLADVFDSQAQDSQSQLPPIGLAGAVHSW